MLVAEELECDWKKVKVEYASANEDVGRKRAWATWRRWATRTIRNSQEYLRKGGATAREMLIAAAAQKWKVPEPSARGVRGRHQSRREQAQDHLRQGGERRGEDRGAEGSEAQGPEGLEDRLGAIWRVDIPDTVKGLTLRHRYAAPRHAVRGDRAVPGIRRQGQTLDDSKIRGRRGIIKVLPMENFVAVEPTTGGAPRKP